jgi:hypothetical protein
MAVTRSAETIKMGVEVAKLALPAKASLDTPSLNPTVSVKAA